MQQRILSVVVAGALGMPAPADIIHVPADQPTIGAAIDAANPGDEIVVAPGTYVEGLLTVDKALTLRASDGAEVTTIAGDGVFPLVFIQSSAVVIEGFTLSGGTHVEDIGIPAAGISVMGDFNPMIVDCVLTGNSSDEAEAGGAIGGFALSSCTAVGCTFMNNGAWGGGAIRLAAATISDCTFDNNAATVVDGGAVEIDQGTIENSTFINNSAARHGGAVHGLELSVSTCTFIDNTASSDGGALHASGGTVTDCAFESNVAGSGGGAWLDGAPVVTGCTFSANSAGSGGGLRMVGGEITGSAFDANDATGNGAGLYLTGTSPAVTQCTLGGNTAGATGGGLYVGNGVTAALTDVTFCQNTPDAFDSDGVLQTSNVVIAAGGAACDQAVITLGPCCLPAAGCVVTTESNCVSAGGAYQGDGVPCRQAACPEACPADLDADGAVGVPDFLALLAAWGPCPD